MATKKETTETKANREKELEAALEAMKKEKEALLEEVESLKKAPEPVAEETEEDADYWNERVPYEAFYDGDKYSDDISVKVNGERYLIKRGERVMIPRKVLHVLENAEKQKRYSADYNRKLQERFEKETKVYIGE